eukprot:364927-Chlamydomonas_euryale.AAC.23
MQVRQRCTVVWRSRCGVIVWCGVVWCGAAINDLTHPYARKAGRLTLQLPGGGGGCIMLCTPAAGCMRILEKAIGPYRPDNGIASSQS